MKQRGVSETYFIGLVDAFFSSITVELISLRFEPVYRLAATFGSAFVDKKPFFPTESNKSAAEGSLKPLFALLFDVCDVFFL